MRELELLKQQLLNMMSSRSANSEEFNQLALRVFAAQFENNSPYQKYCLSLGLSAKDIDHWHDIPCVSTDTFKVKDHPLSVMKPDEEPEAVFLTSGTTTEVKGRHIFPTLDIYEHAILNSWGNLSLPDPETLVILSPHPDHAPHSSLSHMMGVLAAHYGKKEVIWAANANGSMNFDILSSLSQKSGPVAMLGTAIAFLHLFENATIPLPHGSFAMETGGYKGTQRQMEKADLYELFERHLALPAASVINEYSMTELSSQFYTRGLDQPHTGPSWVRTRVIDPITGTDTEYGTPGHLAIYDLANLYSVSALQTQDIAIAKEDGSFTLLGRDPSALPRGCSRASDLALS